MKTSTFKTTIEIPEDKLKEILAEYFEAEPEEIRFSPKPDELGDLCVKCTVTKEEEFPKKEKPVIVHR